MPTNKSQNVVRTQASDTNPKWKKQKQIMNNKFQFD